ncbi:hypothetical protein, partial [Pectobacterium brasiliense]|uniref:hypothetical protein n=1 Tax=Pectobacterium brasiliense TaxID=180957 RepID=UPI001F46BB82
RANDNVPDGQEIFVARLSLVNSSTKWNPALTDKQSGSISTTPVIKCFHGLTVSFDSDDERATVFSI